jgi:hypothetical protein
VKRFVSFVLLTAGIALIVCAVYATDSLQSDFSRFVDGVPKEKSIWLMIGGIVIGSLGARGLIRGKNSS